MRKYFPLFLLFITGILSGCNNKTPDSNRKLIAEVNGSFLYLDEVQQIVPPNALPEDSVELAQKYIQKWATDVLVYEKAKQNISDITEIDRLVNEYRKTLTIHQYQQGLIERDRKAQDPTEEEMMNFYEHYSNQMILKENIIKGLLLIVPVDAPNISNVSKWVKNADQESLENIEKYSLQNAVSYDYFRDTWIPFAEVLRKTAFNTINPSHFISNNTMVEETDSTHHYFLRIDEYLTAGNIEPYELAKNKIKNILLTKRNSDIIIKLENQLYQDALSRRTLRIYSVNEGANQ